jgi:indole-3-glycerol phosphate synthase
MSVLARILASKRSEIEGMKAEANPASTVRRSTIDVARALRRGPGAPLRIVTEVKKKSPSAGELSKVLDAGARALAYGRAGAAMVSVLCDRPFFDGSWADLAQARQEVDRLSRDVPLLAKEFVLDEVQLDRARAAGADAVLLIARIVGPGRLRELYDAARARDLEPLVEVVDELEVETALRCEARVIGVNARDLDTLAMDAERTARVLAAIPSSCVRIHLSGVKSESDVRELARGPADAVLVGEMLMREDDPGPRLRALVAAASA